MLTRKLGRNRLGPFKMLVAPYLRSLGPSLLLATLLSACCRNDILVTVENATGQPLSELVVEAKPSRMALGDLAPHQKKSGAFVPTQDTSLFLEFSTSDGKRINGPVNSYFTHGTCGEVELVIGPDFQPSMHQDIDFGPCWLGPILNFFGE